MPTSPSSSIGSPDPYETVSDPDVEPALAPVKWLVPALLFVATVASILCTAAYAYAAGHPGEPFQLVHGVSYTASLLAILLTHEFAHYAAARYHGVNASLPHFIPMPFLTPFGTMGAVILMRDRIKSKNALLDIGASGPLAGMLVAIPVLLYGLAHSEVLPPADAGMMQEGQSLFYWLLKSIAIGPIPEGWDVQLSPMAFAGWTGLFITMLNLLPVGQLDGGHVAYALLGPRQNRVSNFIRWSLLLLVPMNALWRLAPALHSGLNDKLISMAISASTMWLGWFVVLTVLQRLSGDHPPTEPGELSPVRRIVAVGTLVLFVLLFMPTPIMSY